MSTASTLPIEQETALVPQDQAAQQLSKTPRSIKDLLQGEEIRAAVAAALPRHLTPERFIRVALNAVMRQPDLLNCTKESFFRCLLDLSAYGLEPDGRRAHLIPFRNNKTHTLECQLIIDYKGLAELVRRSGDVSYIHADVVYENDIWDFTYGSGAFLKHKPALENRGDKRIAFYSFVRLRDGSEDFIVFGPSQVEKIRQKSRAKDSGPWVEWYDEMGKKTVFRNHSKWLPLSPETKQVIERDDDFAGADVAEALSAVDEIGSNGTPEPPLISRTAALKDRLRNKSSEEATPASTEAADGSGAHNTQNGETQRPPTPAPPSTGDTGTSTRQTATHDKAGGTSTAPADTSGQTGHAGVTEAPSKATGSPAPEIPAHIALLEGYRNKVGDKAFYLILSKARRKYPEGFSIGHWRTEVPAELANQIIFDLEDEINAQAEARKGRKP